MSDKEKRENPMAFPSEYYIPNRSSDPLATPVKVITSGMTLRDYFAGQAIVAILSLPDVTKKETQKHAAQKAYGLADAMLKARAQDD